MNQNRRLAPVCAGLLVASLVGCGAVSDPQSASDGHDHGHDHDEHGHDHHHAARPHSLHAAVAQLTSMRDTIRDAIVDGDPDDAHGPLHEVGALLEAIPDVAAETDLPEEEWDAVKAANEELFAAFGAIDKAFHMKDGDKKKAYEDVAEQLDGAIESIRSRLPLTGEDPDDHDGHDHDGHDHDGHDHDGHGHGHDHDHDEEGDEGDSPNEDQP